MEFLAELKGYDKVVISEVFPKPKFKKYALKEPQVMHVIHGVYYQDFVDEDNGEVITIERKQNLGIVIDGFAYHNAIYVWSNNIKRYIIRYKPVRSLWDITLDAYIKQYGVK